MIAENLIKIIQSIFGNFCFKFHQNSPSFSLPFDSTEWKILPFTYIPIRNLYTQRCSLAEQIFSRHKANARKNPSHRGKKNLSCARNHDDAIRKEFSPRGGGDRRFHLTFFTWQRHNASSRRASRMKARGRREEIVLGEGEKMYASPCRLSVISRMVLIPDNTGFSAVESVLPMRENNARSSEWIGRRQLDEEEGGMKIKSNYLNAFHALSISLLFVC